MNEMFTAKNLLEPTNLALFFGICCVVTYAMTTIVRPFLKMFVSNKDLKTALVQLVSCVFGGFVGFEMSSYATLGLWLGFGSGALNVVVVSYIKKRLGSEVANMKLKTSTEPSPKPQVSKDTEAPKKAPPSEDDFL